MSLIAQTIRSLYRQLDPEIRLLGILITLFDKNTALDHAILSLLRERIEAEFSAGYLFDNVIPRNIQVSETEFGNLPMILSQPEASASISYKAVAQEMLARMEQGQRQG
jgi:chromosome partitioning protein